MGCPHPDFIPLTASQLIDWMGYYELEPFGQEWKQAALTAWMQSQSLQYKGRRPTIEDFMPVRKRIVRQTPQQIEMMLKAFTRMQQARGQKDNR